MKLELPIILSQIAAFLIMLAILKRFAWRPIQALLKERQEKISEEFARAEKKMEEADQLKTLYSEQLAHIESQAWRIKNDAIEEGQKSAAQIKEEAHTQARLMWHRAHADIEHQWIQAQEQVKQRVAELTFLAAQKLMKEKMDEEKERKIIQSVLDHGIDKVL